MLSTAAKAGIRPLDFWDMTPAELMICIQGFVVTKTESLKQSITVAYMNASWSRAKKMPRLETVLRKIDNTTKKKEAQTPEEMYAVAVAMTKRLSKAR